MNTSQLLERLHKAEQILEQLPRDSIALEKMNRQEFVLELGIASDEFGLLKGFQRKANYLLLHLNCITV